MYSVVLMMALGSGAEVPAWGGHGCHGGYSCDGGGCYGGCYGGGGCHGGFMGGRRHGCHGGGLFGGRRRHGCHGGGACYGGGCWGGACYGGGCWGGACYGGGYGGCHGGAAVVGGCYGGHGCVGGMPVPYGPGPGPQEMPRKGPEKVPAPKSTGGEDKEVAVPAPATIVVSLPAEAKLLIDDAATTSTSDLRVFASPSLEPGKDFYYTLKGELVREGRTLTTSQRVKVRAGEQTRIQLEFPVTSVAQK